MNPASTAPVVSPEALRRQSAIVFDHLESFVAMRMSDKITLPDEDTAMATTSDPRVDEVLPIITMMWRLRRAYRQAVDDLDLDRADGRPMPAAAVVGITALSAAWSATHDAVQPFGLLHASTTDGAPTSVFPLQFLGELGFKAKARVGITKALAAADAAKAGA